MFGGRFAEERVDGVEGGRDESDAGFDGAEERVDWEVPGDVRGVDPDDECGDADGGADDGDEGDGY